MSGMRRREFVSLLGSAVATWPLAARAQQPGIPVIGFLDLGSSDPSSAFGAAFRQGLADAGYHAGQNVTIEYRSANNQVRLLPRLAADLVERKAAVIVAIGSPYAALAAKEATSAIPIVFAIADDPVRYGLVTSLGRPGGSVTGMTFLSAELAGKRLNLLLELIPQATTIAYLSGPLQRGVRWGGRSLWQRFAVSTSKPPSPPLSSSEPTHSSSAISLFSLTQATATKYWSSQHATRYPRCILTESMPFTAA